MVIYRVLTRGWWRFGDDAPAGLMGLAMTERDPAFCEIVRREFEGDFIAGEDADAIAAEAACEVGQDDAIMLEFDAEEAAGELF